MKKRINKDLKLSYKTSKAKAPSDDSGKVLTSEEVRSYTQYIITNPQPKKKPKKKPKKRCCYHNCEETRGLVECKHCQGLYCKDHANAKSFYPPKVNKKTKEGRAELQKWKEMKGHTCYRLKQKPKPSPINWTKIILSILAILLIVVAFSNKDLISNYFTQEVPRVVEEVSEEEPEPPPQIQEDSEVLEKGKTIEYEGAQITLIDVNSGDTFCRISIDGQTYLITQGTSKKVGRTTIEVYEPIHTPRKMCGVYLR